MDTKKDSTIPEVNTETKEDIRKRHRSEYGKKWRQANKDRKKAYQENWTKQRKMLEANAIRITEDEFVTLLEARKSILDTAKEMIGIGFDIHSKFCESLFNAAEKIGKALANRIGIRAWACMPYDYNSLEWALEYLDKGEPAVVTFENKDDDIATDAQQQKRIVKIYNYKQLFRMLIEEAEQKRPDETQTKSSNKKKLNNKKTKNADNEENLFPMFFIPHDAENQ